ncbi:ABC transporter ATP-binding protein [Pantoea sp. Acro-805]|uniref:ABC transporter ATP-binding protein n=1 Tax=Candidatus Pantoea formicae TaxID=2608355 RepID=A0ABX0R1F6_9GAMM|nr:ABC transporter ATP-binding protein [Pantoea formicae]NIF03058.1 ABC transporter ATP-binding protein [Pantoea formicae]
MIKIEDLTKSYKTPNGRHFVFKNLNIEIPSDKSIALIGRNGAGKSTLLRMIGGIDIPDKGKISTQKSISWPVGLSGGFQGSLTGRENVKFVARLYSKNDELKHKVDFVENFAELGKYFDMPIKTYSSGMKSRLGFGLSMAFNFDYYLVDEVTAVGDANFKKKCSELFKSRHLESNFIMVSHSLKSLKEFCDASIYIGRENEVTYYNKIDDAIDNYLKDEMINSPADYSSIKQR